MTEFSKAQLDQILSALDGARRNPNSKAATLKGLARHAARLGLGVDDLLAAAPGLLDGRLTPEAFRATLAETQEDTTEAEPEAEPAVAAPARRTRADSKQARLIALLQRPEGATIAEIAASLGWQPHTVRGAIAGALKKRLGLAVISEKSPNGERLYRIPG